MSSQIYIQERKHSPFERCLFYVVAITISCFLFTSKASAQGDPDDIYWDDSFFGVGEVRGEVKAIAVKDSFIYIGGHFIRDSSWQVGNNIIKFVNGRYEHLEAAIDSGIVFAIAANDTGIVVGGFFVSADSLIANNIAIWDGTRWDVLGSGANGAVRAIVIQDTNIYIGGAFDTVGGIFANHVAKWDGHQWSALDSGVSGVVYSLAYGENKLFAGGRFSNADTTLTNNIAYWDGSQWNAMGNGVDNTVYALSYCDSALYVGGRFEIADDSSANHIAKWKGSIWSPIGSGSTNGTDEVVFAINAVSSRKVFVGGHFTSAGNVSANKIALWDSSSWSNFGSGADEFVLAIGISDNDLYIGGVFQRAGADTNYGAFINRWNKPPDTLGLIIRPREGDLNTGSGFEVVQSNVNTNLKLAVPKSRKVTSSLLDKNGNVLKSSSQTDYLGNQLTLSWNVQDLSPGEYYFRVESGSEVRIKKVIVK